MAQLEKRVSKTKAGLSRKSAVLTRRGEEILKTIHFYRYMTATDVTNLLYSPKSLTYVRSLLTELAGGADDIPREYLYRFRLPGDSAGQRVYTLGSRGRDFLANELGLPVDWYFRPYKAGSMSYSQMTHNLVLTRVLVAASLFARCQPHFELSQIRICYELGNPPSPQGGKKLSASTIIPDAWLLFQRVKDGKRFPVLLEIDRGTAHQHKFKQHVTARIEYIQSGAYEARFGIQAVVIAYATTGSTPTYARTRRQAMCAWTKETLAKLHKEAWAGVFRFHSLSLESIYSTSLFEDALWYRPDSPQPVRLFAA